MSTRSTIAVEHDDGSVSQIYCHWDGYMDHNGKILQEHYHDQEKVFELISLGSLSILGEEIGEKQNFDEPIDGMCLAYHRDRGEKLVIRVFGDLAKWATALHAKEEYNYIMLEGEWYCFTEEKMVKLASKAKKLI